MAKPMAQRSPAMDVIRTLALFFVVSVHFFYNNGFYAEPVDEWRMYVMTGVRAFLMICVPLFMMLSGYLMCRKPISRDYYKKFWYVAGIYVLASAACLLYKIHMQEQTFTGTEILRGFFGYTHAKYAWYVEMYFTFFLFAPFLNVLYNNLASKKQKLLLIGTMLVATSLPGVLNTFGTEWSWFADPTVSKTYFQVLPDFFVAMYPITYYFIGCYLREYPPKMSAWKLALLGLAVALINGAYNVWRSHGVKFASGAWEKHSSILVVVQAILFFAFFMRLSYAKMPRWVAWIFAKISQLSFGAYLVSWIFDTEWYPRLKEAVPVMPDRMEYYFLIVPAVFVCSVLLSAVLEIIYRAVAWVMTKLFALFKKPSAPATEE